MGLTELMDTAARERRRRLLGEDMVATVRRAKLATTPGTLMNGFNTSALRSSSAVAGTWKTMVEEHTLMEHEDANASHSLLQVEQAHRRSGTTPSEEADGLETLILGQHTALEGKFSKVDDSKDSDSDGNDNMMMPIFVRHGSGELTFTVRKHESTNGIMQLYAKRTKTALESQYFVYDRKRLEPHHTWSSCGLKRDTTVHVCTRLLGGVGHPNLQEYINNNKHRFVTTATLPNDRASLQMAPIGCQFLSSWIRCFTSQFIQGKSWNGEFELVDFKFVDGHVRPIKKAHVREPSAMSADITEFADKVKRILNFSDIPYVVSSHPPYVQSCMKMLCDLVGPLSGPITDEKGHLLNKYKVLLDTLVCCMTSNARESLIIELYRKYEGADNNETLAWEKAIKDACRATQFSHLSRTTAVRDLIRHAKKAGNPYSFETTGAFTLLRDVVMHATDHSVNPRAPKLDDGIELMIPAALEGFLPIFIKNLIENGIEISKELSAAISCACDICDA